MHSEYFEIPAHSRAINIREKGGRSLLYFCCRYESQSNPRKIGAGSGETNLLSIRYNFKLTDILLTNFHLPVPPY